MLPPPYMHTYCIRIRRCCARFYAIYATYAIRRAAYDDAAVIADADTLSDYDATALRHAAITRHFFLFMISPFISPPLFDYFRCAITLSITR